MGKLPNGYHLTYANGPRPLEPMVLSLKRPDRSLVATFSPGDPLEAIKRAAWRDHRARTLRVVTGGNP